MSKPDEAAFARFLLRTIGARSAGGYLRKRGWSLEAALFALFRKMP
jgi:hypothetical protein